MCCSQGMNGSQKGGQRAPKECLPIVPHNHTRARPASRAGATQESQRAAAAAVAACRTPARVVFCLFVFTTADTRSTHRRRRRRGWEECARCGSKRRVNFPTGFLFISVFLLLLLLLGWGNSGSGTRGKHIQNQTQKLLINTHHITPNGGEPIKRPSAPGGSTEKEREREL